MNHGRGPRLLLSLVAIMWLAALPAVAWPASVAQGRDRSTLRLTLADCLQRAVTTSPRLGEAKARYDEAGAAIDEARVLGRPDLRLSAETVRSAPGFQVASPFGTFTIIPKTNVGAAITLRQPLWTGGRLTAAVHASKAAQASSLQGFERAAHDLQTDVRVAFQDVVLSEALIEVANENLALQQQQLDVSRTQYKAGAVPRYNVLSAEALHSQAEQQLLEAQKARALAADRLLSLIGVEPGQPIELVRADPTERVHGPVEDWIPLAEGRRPEIRQLDATIRAAEARRQLERAQNAPRVDLQLQQSEQTRTAVNNGHQFTIGAQLSIPLYDGGLSSARARQVSCQIVQLRDQREEARRNVVLEVRQAYTDLTNAYARLEVAERNVAQAREALRAARVRYAAGLSVLVELQSAQTSLVEALVNHSQVRYQCEVSMSRWARAIGDPLLDTSIKEVQSR